MTCTTKSSDQHGNYREFQVIQPDDTTWLTKDATYDLWHGHVPYQIYRTIPGLDSCTDGTNIGVPYTKVALRGTASTEIHYKSRSVHTASAQPAPASSPAPTPAATPTPGSLSTFSSIPELPSAPGSHPSFTPTGLQETATPQPASLPPPAIPTFPPSPGLQNPGNPVPNPSIPTIAPNSAQPATILTVSNSPPPNELPITTPAIPPEATNLLPNAAGYKLPNSATLHPGSHTILSGTSYSLSPSTGNPILIIDTSTISLSPTPAHLPPYLLPTTLLSDMSLLPSATGVALPNGRTLRQGDQTTISGTRYALETGAAGVLLVVGSATVTISPAWSALPSGRGIVFADGWTVGPGGVGTVGGTPVSVGEDGSYVSVMTTGIASGTTRAIESAEVYVNDAAHLCRGLLWLKIAFASTGCGLLFTVFYPLIM